MPYELLVKDFTKSNYSSMRSALLEFWRHVMCEQSAMRDTICDPIYRMVIRDAYARGKLPTLPGFTRDPDAFLACNWIRPPRGWVDPMKEIQSTVEEIGANLTSATEAAANLGRDFGEVSHARAGEIRDLMALEEQYGLPAGSLTKAAAPAPAPAAAPPPGVEPDEEDDDEPEDQDEDEAQEGDDDA